MVHQLRLAFRGQVIPSYRAGMGLVAGSGVLFSFTPLFFRAVESATAWQFLALRGLGTAAAAVMVMVARRKHRPVVAAAFNLPMVAAGVLIVGLSTLFILALERTTTALILFLQCAGPFSAALFGWLFLSERVTGRTWAAMTVATVGVGVMVAGGLGDGLDAGSSAGVLLALGLPVLLGLYNVAVKVAPVADPMVPALVGGVVMAVSAGTVAVSSGTAGLSGRDIVLGVAAGALLLGLGLPMFNLGHLSVPAAQLPLLLMTEIVLAPLWVWIWPGEVPARSTLLGGVVIMAAVVVLAVGPSRVGQSLTDEALAEERI